MGDLAQTRNRFTMWLSVMAVLSLAFLVYLLWPGARGPQPEALQARYQSLRHEVDLWHRSNPEKTREALKAFYAQNVATRPSQISQEVEKLVRENGVATQGTKYDFNKTPEKNEPPGVQRIKVEITVSGDYTKIARFVNALEQSKLLFIIDSISLSNQEGGSVVTLHLSFDTFLKEAA